MEMEMHKLPMWLPEASVYIQQAVYDSGILFMKRAKHALRNEEGKYYELLVVMRDYYKKRISTRVDIDMEGCISSVKRILAGHRELLLEFKAFLPEQCGKSDVSSSEGLSSPQNNAVDVLKCENINPSYRGYPEYAVASGRTKADASVLNDHWKSGLPGEEESPKKCPPALTCEEKRYELDMIIKWFEETITQVEELLKIFEDAPSNVLDGSLHIKEFFTASSLMCIERLYGDHGLDIIDLMEKNARTALPTFLFRLNQKRDELIRLKRDFNERNKVTIRTTSRGVK